MANEKLRELVAKWRKEGDRFHDNADEWDNNYADGMGDATKDCADELEAALAAEEPAGARLDDAANECTGNQDCQHTCAPAKEQL